MKPIWKFERVYRDYYVTKDGKRICKIKYHHVNMINRTFWEICDIEPETDFRFENEEIDSIFNYLADAKKFIKANF